MTGRARPEPDVPGAAEVPATAAREPDATAPDDGRAVGVGPWPGGPDAWPALDVDGVRRYDPELLAHGDRRNVVDRYRYWTVEAVVADLDLRRHPFHVAVENWVHDLNIGSVVRTANAFAAAEVHVVGRRRWNRRGAMVTDRYQHVRHHPDVGHLRSWAATAGSDGGRLPVLGVDNLPGSVALEGYPLPRACVLLFGQEGEGLSTAAREACDDVLHIRQFGSTRSINAAAAAAIAMHTWVTLHA